jgi:hypothetical protein
MSTTRHSNAVFDVAFLERDVRYQKVSGDLGHRFAPDQVVDFFTGQFDTLEIEFEGMLQIVRL